MWRGISRISDAYSLKSLKEALSRIERFVKHLDAESESAPGGAEGSVGKTRVTWKQVKQNDEHCFV